MIYYFLFVYFMIGVLDAITDIQKLKKS